MIVSIEFGTCQAVRAVDLGCNARLPFHGRVMLDPIVRLRIDSGVEGFGWSSLTCKEEARALLGKKVGDLISRECGVVEEGRKVEAALWDLLGKICGVPVFRLLGGDSGATVYFTHLYFSDLGVKDDADACKLLAEEAKSGVAQGHTAFKMKVGRGAMHMPLLEGTERDIKIIKAVRAVVGPEAVLMIDANNGYNLNIAKWVLTETKECKLFWLEEAFHEDPVLYKALKGWMKSEGIETCIADGEGVSAAAQLVEWCQDGAIDFVQYSAREKGFTFWLALAKRLGNKAAAPHNFGSCLSCYTTLHLASALGCSVEWDIGESDAFDTSAYGPVRDGKVKIPEEPGFGIRLNDQIFKSCKDCWIVQ